MIHGPHRLLDRRGGVRAVTVDKIDVIHIQSLERSLGTFNDVLPGEALVIGTGTAPEDLGGDDDVGALPSELPNGLAHDLLGPAIGVDFGVVEEIDAMVTATLEKRFGLPHIELVSEADPSPVG